jgi:hypothetical protein
MKTAALAILAGLAAVSMAKAKPHSTLKKEWPTRK